MTPEEVKGIIQEEAVKCGGMNAMQDKNTHTLVLRTGEAPQIKDPVSVSIYGVIDTPLKWLQKRFGTIDLMKCHVRYSREEMGIKLKVNERDYFADEIGGKLMLSEEFKKFGINSGDYVTGLELSDLIRMNRTCFADKKVAMELVTIMRNFKATITTQIENSDDKKGNVSQLRRQTVEGNQPPSFELCIPIFKGQPKVSFTVEIDIDPDTLQATLVSPDAQDLIVEKRDELIDRVLAGIEELCPDIPIIEI